MGSEPTPSMPHHPSSSPPQTTSSQHSPSISILTNPFSRSTSLTHPSSQLLTLPDESNSYLGFCKGAYKLQIGLPNKKAFGLQTRPAALYSTYTVQVWQCSKCSFEGPVVLVNPPPAPGKKAAKPEKIFDPKLRTSAAGIVYRWSFLAKSHVDSRGMTDGARDQEGHSDFFGCLFCCAEGARRGWLDGSEVAASGVGGKRGSRSLSPTTATTGTPMFNGVDAFMHHLEMHRTPAGMPGYEMQGRMKCVVGRIADVGEEFDINLPPFEQ